MSSRAAIYLAGHGSKVRPRLIELQHRRIQRYCDALGAQFEMPLSVEDIFLDLRLPRYGMGYVDLQDVPAFNRLRQRVQAGQYSIVFIDLDETRPGLTPDYESAFVREFLEQAGAKVLNSFSDDGSVFETALKQRCGANARGDDVADSSDLVCFFPALASEITSAVLRRELQDSAAPGERQLARIIERIEALRGLRPYSGGGKPFIEDRLSFEWRKPK